MRQIIIVLFSLFSGLASAQTEAKLWPIPDSADVTFHAHQTDVYEDQIPLLIIKANCVSKSDGDFAAKIEMLAGKAKVDGVAYHSGQAHVFEGKKGHNYLAEVHPYAKARVTNLSDQSITLHCKIGT